MNKWRLIAPAEDPGHPFEFDESNLGLLTFVGESLHLRMTRDDEQRKFYLGLPKDLAQAPKATSGGEGVKYPSGVLIPKAVLSECTDQRSIAA